jgi:Fur family ferric uptake transcriptional regulator
VPTTARDLLREHGLRVTAARVAVLDVLAARGHQSADEVAAAARDRIGSLSSQAVYHVLGTLTDTGLLRRIEPAGSAARYERRVGDNHHHLVCRGCGAVADVDCDEPGVLCIAPADTLGYLVDEAEVVFWGLCPACLEAEAVPSTTQRSRQ